MHVFSHTLVYSRGKEYCWQILHAITERYCKNCRTDYKMSVMQVINVTDIKYKQEIDCQKHWQW